MKHRRLTPDEIAKARMLHEKYKLNATVLAERFGVLKTQMGRLLSGETYAEEKQTDRRTNGAE